MKKMKKNEKLSADINEIENLLKKTEDEITIEREGKLRNSCKSIVSQEMSLECMVVDLETHIDDMLKDESNHTQKNKFHNLTPRLTHFLSFIPVCFK